MKDKKTSIAVYVVIVGVLALVGGLYFLSKKETPIDNRSDDHMEKMRAAKAAKAKAEAEALTEEKNEEKTEEKTEDESI